MKKNISIASAVIILFAACKKDPKENPKNEIPTPEGYTLVWSDEFDGQTINPLIWTFETGDGTAYGLPPGWGNNEKQIYTNDASNASITTHEGNNVLAITALDGGGGQYSSAKLTTNGLKSMRFGRVDVRAKVPTGQGIWPAIWMLGDNRGIVDWPGCGEIDIAEILGKESNKLYTTLHYVNGDQKKGELQGMKQRPSGLYSDAFHTYSIDWTPEKITFLLDGNAIHAETIQSDMKEFLRSFYLILNVAVGGFWPGNPDATTQFPSTMYVDFVRVYSKNGLVIPEAPVLNIAEETIGQPTTPNLADVAIKEGFTDFGDITILIYGGGGEPAIRQSDTAVDGAKSLVYDFPGTSWGGAYIQMTTTKNLSSFNSLKFSLRKPAALHNAEIKLESPSTNAIVFLKDYTPVPVNNGFVEYTIPLTDFVGLNLNDLRIVFAMWNATDVNQNFVPATVYVDNLHMAN